MISRWTWVSLVLAIVLMSACRPAVIRSPQPGAVPEPAPEVRPPAAVDDELRGRDRVAAALTEQGQAHLKAGRVDAAMRLFEQALAQSPHFGPAYFYLAECWYQKGNSTQAYAFHGQADLYLSEDRAWRERLRGQKTAFDNRFSALIIP
jgi:tetratricopeptide (TPR) repeat protein